jgi:hypothetical protein
MSGTGWFLFLTEPIIYQVSPIEETLPGEFSSSMEIDQPESVSGNPYCGQVKQTCLHLAERPEPLDLAEDPTRTENSQLFDLEGRTGGSIFFCAFLKYTALWSGTQSTIESEKDYLELPATSGPDRLLVNLLNTNRGYHKRAREIRRLFSAKPTGGCGLRSGPSFKNSQAGKYCSSISLMFGFWIT